ncbi:MAG: hypothetical protein JWO74_5037 [Solirubrobacterales bacterium]|nr:hypothetical protein [Solirubrobacterales bacterium]
MHRMLKRRVAVGAVGLTALAGGGIAYATTKDPGATDRKALLDDVAKRLNVAPSDLQAALQGAASDQLDKAVAAGRLTRPQADAMKQRLKDGGGLPLIGGGRRLGFAHPGRFGPGRGLLFAGPDAAAKYLGLDAAALRDQLASGKSLADVAKAQGKDVAGLEQALVDAAQSRLDQAVADKRITEQQRQSILDRLKSRVADLVSGKRSTPPPPPAPPPGHP